MMFLFLSILFVTLFAQRTDVKTFVNTRQVYTRQVVVIIIAFPSFFLFIQTEDDKREREKMEKKRKKKKEIEHIIFPPESQLVLGILRCFQTSGNR